MGGMTLGQFMGRQSGRGGGRRSYLKDPKKWKDNAVTIWLSCQASIYPLWRHPFQRVEVVEDKDTKQKRREVWQNKLVCYEHEETLDKQYWRNKDTHQRDFPPLVCPHCLMVEDIYQRVKSGELDWRTPVFRFTGSDPTKTMRFGRTIVNVGDVFLHAGGICGLFGDKNMGDGKKKELAEIPKEQGGPVYQNSAFRQNNITKMEWVFTVVDNDDVPAGLQVAIMPNLLGEKMQDALKKRVESKGEKDGNPLLHPVAFRWTHDPSDDVEFSKKYDAYPVERVQLSPAVDKLIRSTEPPNVASLLAKFNWKTHRAALERHALVKLPWDTYFAEVAKRYPNAGQTAPAEEERNSSSVRAPEVGRPPPAAPPPPVVEEDLFGCDKCGAEMRASDTECKSCGEKYVVEGPPPPPPPPPAKPPLPKRSEARSAAGAAPAPAAPPPDDAFSGEETGGGGYPGDPDDDIPFIRNASVFGVREAWWR